VSEQPVVIEGIRPGIRTRHLDRGQPVVDWLCACSHHQRATGREAVQQLLATARAGHCPHQETP